MNFFLRCDQCSTKSIWINVQHIVEIDHKKTTIKWFLYISEKWMTKLKTETITICFYFRFAFKKKKILPNILAFDWILINSKSSFQTAVRFGLSRTRSFIQMSSVLTSLVNAAIDKYEPMLIDTMHALNRQIWIKIMYCMRTANV